MVAGLGLLAWQSFIAMPSAAAGSAGSSAASAIPIAASGRFAGTVGPLSSSWFRVVYLYQRFQRGILHRIVSQGTFRGILLADYLKAILLDRDLPTDLRAQAQGRRFLAQYRPTQPAALCRPAELEVTDLSFAFETG